MTHKCVSCISTHTARLGFVISLILAKCLVDGSCVHRDKVGVHVGAVAFNKQSNALSNTDGGWVRVLHQFKRCNDRLPPACPKTAGWNCYQGSSMPAADLNDWVQLIKAYQGAGRKVLLNVNGWAIPACVEAPSDRSPPAPQDITSPYATWWLEQYEEEMTRLVKYLKNNGALPEAIQVGNEPNSIEDMNYEFFGLMLKAADTILKAEVPNVLRVTGGVVRQEGALCLQQAAQHASGVHYHGVGFHLYGTRKSDAYRVDDNGVTIRNLWNVALDEIKDEAAKFGSSPKIWITETGGPLEEAWSDYNTESYKANFLSFTLPHLASKNEVECIFIYRLLSGHEHLGLYKEDGQTKNEAADVVNMVVCEGGLSGGGCNNGWCPCPNDSSIWYDQNASSGSSNSQAVKCDGQTPGGGTGCNNGWCPCPNDSSIWYEQAAPSGSSNSQAVKCDGQTTGGGTGCNNGWCPCPNNASIWYEQNAASGSNNSKAAKCDGHTTGGGTGCNNGWCPCPNNSNIWYEQNAPSGSNNSKAVKCDGQASGGGTECNNGWCRCPNNSNIWYDQNAPSGSSNSQGMRCV